jgi:prevent-host-death family protein
MNQKVSDISGCLLPGAFGTSDSIGAYKAKTHLPELLRRVELGETITITKHGKPVAVMVPPSAIGRAVDVKSVIAAMLEFRDTEGPRLKGMTLRQLVEEGRRF